MIPGTTASHTGPGMRWYEHTAVVSTDNPTMPAHPAIAGNKILYGGYDIGVISIDNMTPSAIASKTTRYTQAQIGYGTSSPAAKPIFDNGGYIYTTDNTTFKTAATLGGTLTSTTFASAQHALWVPHASRWFVGGNQNIATGTSMTAAFTTAQVTTTNFNQVRGAAVSSNALIVGCNGGIFRSVSTTIASNSFTQIGTGSGIRVVTYDGPAAQKYFVAAGNNGVLYYSTDNGLTFTQKVTGFSTAKNIYGCSYWNGHWFISGDSDIFRSDTSDPNGTWRLMYTRPQGASMRYDRIVGIPAGTTGVTDAILISSASEADGKVIIST